MNKKLSNLKELINKRRTLVKNEAAAEVNIVTAIVEPCEVATDFTESTKVEEPVEEKVELPTVEDSQVVPSAESSNVEDATPVAVEDTTTSTMDASVAVEEISAPVTEEPTPKSSKRRRKSKEDI